MSKASFATKDAYTPTGLFQEGNFTIKEAAIVVAQYNPNRDTGEQAPPFLAARLTLQPLDASGKQPADAEPFEKSLRIEGDLSKLRPGKAKSREDNDPEDLGDEVGTEGNCIYCDGASKINANSIWSVFVKSIEDLGFKPGLLGDGWVEDFVGLSAHAITKKSEKRQIRGRDVETNYFVVDKIIERPYEKGEKAATTVKKAAAGAAKANGTVRSIKESPAQNEAADTVATTLLAELTGELTGENREKGKVYAMAYSRLVRDKDRNKALDKIVGDLLRSDEWLASKADDLGYQFANDVFTFA